MAKKHPQKPPSPSLGKIDKTILLSANATVIDSIDLFADVAISRWHIDKNTVTYQKNDSHTLSLYTRGGDTSYRVDKASNKGAAGKLCLMPQGHESKWQINGGIDFAHLYFTDTILKQYAASHFNRDIRFVDLQDLIYQDDPLLLDLLIKYFATCERCGPDAALFGEQLLYQIFHHLVSQYNGFDMVDQTIRGGLSPLHLKQTKTIINEQLQDKLTIDKLANTLGLSPFHFARMFKLSLGESPAQFISRSRIERVKQLLKTTASLSDISFQTGFSQQSHMTSQFKKLTGMTPAHYRKLLLSP